jgi:peptidoglycan hydrolase-like protein with peptidoglycan-binding domain
MNWKAAGAAVLVAVVAPMALGDSALQQAQEQLKEQGYYYGQITGEKNADTTAAIRRFQIRNGLQVTGELNDETVRALSSNSSARVETATPAPQRNEPREETEETEPEGNEAPPPAIPQTPRAPLSQQPRAYRSAPAPLAGDLFGDTPYATAPPQLQRQVLLGVQTKLHRRGLYRGQIDGAFGPELELGLREYQSRVGLEPTGRLDMDTLASLGLLPGQRAPHMPRRRSLAQPPVRGEWIR